MTPGTCIGELTVLREGPKHPTRNRRQWWVKCSCGSPEYLASEENLRRPRTSKCKHCGVYKALHIGVFGDLTVIGLTPASVCAGKQHKGYLDCKCACGRTTSVWAHALLAGDTKACGKCYLSEFLPGQQVGELEIIRWHGCVKGHIPAWEVKCLKCGSPEIFVVYASNLRNGNSKACRKCCAHGLQKHYRTYRVSLGMNADTLITPANRQARDTFRKLARYIKYVRDKRCLLCSETKHLHAHHIMDWACNSALRFAPSNIATLCAECHVKAHSGTKSGPLDPQIQATLLLLVQTASA